MTGTPTIYVDFNRRDPRRPYRFYASLHRIQDAELAQRVRASDYEEFDVEAVIVGIDHLNGLVMLDLVDESSMGEDARRMRIEPFTSPPDGQLHRDVTVDHADLEPISPEFV